MTARRPGALGVHSVNRFVFSVPKLDEAQRFDTALGIDFVPADLDWPAADHPPEDLFYVWGPSVPEDFIANFESEPSTPGGARPA